MALAKNKKKKTDYGALQSPFMRIPKMNVRGARGLLDLGFKEIYEIRGRDPESLFCDLKKKRIDVSGDILDFFRIAVEFAERDDGF